MKTKTQAKATIPKLFISDIDIYVYKRQTVRMIACVC